MHQEKIQDLISRGALFVVNHSAGKDSQAMFLHLQTLVPAKQLVVVHAHLGGIEWEGTIPHIYKTVGETPVHVTMAKTDFWKMVERRGYWPSPKYRQCTSDLKRTPIEREIRAILKTRELSLVVNCQGLRAEESPRRAKAETFKFSDRNSKAGREWYEWLPIHDWSTDQVFATIAAGGQHPHWAYAAGMSRLSCCFCIMASDADLTRAAELNPDLYRRYAQAERRLGQTFTMPCRSRGRRTLQDITGIQIAT